LYIPNFENFVVQFNSKRSLIKMSKSIKRNADVNQSFGVYILLFGLGINFINEHINNQAAQNKK
jgi:hypothetical protein